MISCSLILNSEFEVNPEDILKLESQERSSIFDDNNSEISEDEEDEYHEETELIDQGGEHVQSTGSEGIDEKENNKTDIEIKETDNDEADNIEQNLKTTKKPKRAEYKVIR